MECAVNYVGGALFTYNATVNLPGNNIFESNIATTGGGLHAHCSAWFVTNSCHNLAVFGSGIYTVNRIFKFIGSFTLRDN